MKTCIQSFFYVLVACFLLGSSGVYAQVSSTLTVDFQPPSGTSISNGETITIPVNLSGGVLFSSVRMQVDYTITLTSSDPGCASQSITISGPTEFITNNGGAIPNYNVSFTVPNNFGLDDECDYQYCIDFEISYASAPNILNNVTTELNGSLISSSNFGSSQPPVHTINNAMCGDFVSDPCPTLQASFTTKTNKFFYVRVKLNATGGSGNYSFSWLSPSPSIGQFNGISCGCDIFTGVVVDNVTGCSDTITEEICSPRFCTNDEFRRIMRTGTTDIIDISVYPNPAEDFLVVKAPRLLDEAIICVHNIKGKKVLEAVLHHGESRINVSALQPGMYLLNVSQEHAVIERQKFIVRQILVNTTQY